MHWAARKGNTKMIKTFHEFGAEVDPKDLVSIDPRCSHSQLNRTPLYFACLNQSVDIVRFLLENHASPWSMQDVPLENLSDNSTIYMMIKVCRRMDLVYKMQLKGPKRDLYWKSQIQSFDFEKKTNPAEKN